MSDGTIGSAADVIAALNEGQATAVTHEGEPLIVLAGPGTGKTRVIAYRVAHLVVARGVDPGKILVSTFTVKAARELRERLAGLIGAAKAERIHAYTLHGLGLRLLHRFGDAIGLPPIGGNSEGARGWERAGEAAGVARRSDFIDSAQSRRLLRDLILDHDLFGSDRAAGVESIIVSAGKHFEFFANHAMDPRAATAAARKWREAVESGRGLDGSVLDDAEREAEAARQRRFEAMVTLYGLYTATRRRRGWITFGDLLMLPIELLRKRADIAAIVRSDFRHVIVDEFQDVDRSMIELLRLVAPPESCRGAGDGGGQELVVVGDDDQAIYGFRGADDRAFFRFESIWEENRRVALSENYRSRERVVCVCNSVIARAAERFEPEKRIETPRKLPRGRMPGDGVVECIGLAEERLDGEVIAAMLSADRASWPEGDTKRWRRYAVVGRTHNDLDRIREALWLEGIPTVQERRTDAMSDEGVQSILAWVRLVVRPREHWHAVWLLSRPPFSCDVHAIAVWQRQYRAALSRWMESDEGGLEGSPDDPGGFAAWLSRAGAGDSRVERFAAWHAEFGRAAADEPAAAALHRIVRDTGVVHADLIDGTDRAERVSAVVALLNFVQERQRRLAPPGRLEEFLNYFDDLDEEEKKLSREEDERRVDDSGESGEETRPDAVRLITAHGAKGLEFHTVFVPRVHPQHGYGKAREDREVEVPMELLDGANGGAAKDANGESRARAEARRLFYVACTRAEERLVLLAKQNKGRSSVANYFEEIRDDPTLKGLVSSISGDSVLQESAVRRGGEPEAATEAGRAGVARTMKDDDRRKELLGRARREVRLSAAGALTMVEAAAAGVSEFEEAMTLLARSARRLAAISALEGGREAPGFCGASDEMVKALAAELRQITDAREAAGKGADGFAPPKPPLILNYTSINEYLTCPRCWYVKQVLGFVGETGRALLVGNALHRTMEWFYKRHRDRDAEGGDGGEVSVEQLLAVARREYLAMADDAEAVSREDMDQLLHQVRLVHSRLHDPTTQVLEIERTINFKYRCVSEAAGADGSREIEHDFRAKLDRIDQITLSDGSVGFRIVDYKTGGASKRILEPAADDLQFGIYVMALRAMYEADVDGVAEYWACSTGQRGQMPFSKMKLDRVRAKIDGVVRGILAGRFERGKDCYGTCNFLGP